MDNSLEFDSTFEQPSNHLHSQSDEFDDDLGVPESLTVIDIEGTSIPVDSGDDTTGVNETKIPDNISDNVPNITTSENNASGVGNKVTFDGIDGGKIEEASEDFADGRIPFNVIYKTPEKFKSLHRDVFIRGKAIEVTITDYERNHTTHLINPNLYTISFVHGGFAWEIKKRYKHFLELHQQLTLFRASLNIPFPTKTHKKKRESFRNNTNPTDTGKKKKKRGVLPRFPKKPEVLILNEHMDSRKKQLEEYLSNLLAISIYRYHPATIEFLEVSQLSFICDLGIKGKEGLVKKRSGSTQPGQSGCNCFGCFAGSCCLRWKHICKDVLCASWRSRWFFVKDTCFGYIDPKTGMVNCVVLFDKGFEVASGMYNTGLNKGLQIQTLSRQIVIKCATRSQRKSWLDTLKEVSATLAYDFTQFNIHHSFAPTRRNIDAAWFVDGVGYMSAAADAMEAAQEEIFIADWWLSPEIYMKRPAIEGDYWRLDKILERKANAGVRVFVLLYKEFELALGLNSYYSKQKLCGLHENIKVLRHPDHAKVGVYFWAHHEKIIVVDQTYAFVGGIDLCYGRWDDHEHRLTDLGSITPNNIDVSTLKKKTSSAPGGDAFYPLPKPHFLQNPEVVVDEGSDVDDASSVSSLPQLQPGDELLMPCRPGEHLKLNTPEMERKNPLAAITKNVKLKGKELFNMVYSQGDGEVKPVHLQPEPELKRDKRRAASVLDLSGSAKYWIGKDYCNFIVKDFTNLDAPFIDFIDRVSTPRMPWHDIGVFVEGASARDIARHFIQRWNATKLEKARINKAYPYILPKSYQTLGDRTKTEFIDTHKVTCQVLRSASTWSIGFIESDEVEQSIHEGYIDAISRSQHYIYIENQFFISLPQSNSNTKNLIAETLFKRIVRAHKENATFRVYVVMPLLPGFEGEVGESTGTSLHAITHWNYASISRGNEALLSRLKSAGIENPSDYISFYGLRTHSRLNGEPITELIYVHSKLMIVDDKLVICGSANINDRSLIGKRDSEIAVLIEDEEFNDGVMNGRSFPSGKYAGSLRRHLFREHLGLIGGENRCSHIDVSDPVSDGFYKDVWQATAQLNTEFYDKVFHCIPTDRVKTFGELKECIAEKPLYMTELARSEQMLKSIEGHLVMLPLNFLCEENLTPASGTVEGMLPTSLWT